MPARPVRLTLAVLVTGSVIAPMAQAAPGGPPEPPKDAEAVGSGGAVSSVDPYATQIGIDVLRNGGSAADAAVAVAAALGVTEPYSAGFGGGGYFVHYDAKTGKVETIDGRETAPASADEDLFLEDGKPIPFDQAVTSGLGVGVPGTPMTWQHALDKWGRKDLAEVLRPAEQLAREGFVVDETFREQTADNEERFRAFPATRDLFLPGGELPEVGSKLRNPDLADTYREVAKRGVDALYDGEIGADVVKTVNEPPVDPAAGREVRPGAMTTDDLRGYRTIDQDPTHLTYRGLDVYGMAPGSSGGTTVGEALNILEGTDLTAADKTQYLHRYLEASKIGFADRNRWVGDPEYSEVPTEALLEQDFADSRACLISDDAVLPTPVAAADPKQPQDCAARTTDGAEPYEGPNTTHLTVADAEGNVVAYTLTIEQTGGSGIVVPGRGFLLNNELTDFSFTPVTPGEPDPNLPGPGKRPRSSMSPTIVLQDGQPLLAVGSPGGATIITTVLQSLTGRLDRGMSLVDAIAEPRASQRNSAQTDAEPAFLAQPEAEKLKAIGHEFKKTAEIGAATGVERLPDGRWVAAAERERRGGGAAAVVTPAR
ncbi:gamma-glutamyltranspeptidase / glutathione hydrolase [Saccharopolyspora kobensis]|uniref:Glutathione hydrolase proenzyme n=1 Tax=Saccharopolyspora kobensis TaxID=146035 RepID=A0A1H5U269_9PSEU|nr:gamma-glutamyltransferase [Saccharopolyspora kobensis]SEF68331.1 gamma-glutamyltranspeptidase / glutathione hydrolase [Saccharopolyspora kobensis]SFC40110.1 gamma-glutamyltranspeptidase / glutathione hydrolase [Saccharopolyspora kobensis]